jgi:DNA-binding transcriptional ArsR family regulator
MLRSPSKRGRDIEPAADYHACMRDGPHIARVASLIGDQARAEILTVLMADRALTATELAHHAGITRATASTHLAKLVDARLLSMVKQGRHRYFRLADRDVARLLESLMGVAFRSGAVRLASSPREPALRKARICYDHLAGELAVWAFERMVAKRVFAIDPTSFALTASGARWFESRGISTESLANPRRVLCRPCLDWGERRHHLAGALGAALMQHCFDLRWARRVANSRVVAFTPLGERELRRMISA